MENDSHSKYIKANEIAWDEVTPIHQSYRSGQENFFKNGGITLDKYELKYLPVLNGKNVAHLCCNCGQDTLSFVNLGAQCTGFDQSGKAINDARKLSRNSGVYAKFVKTNVMDIPKSYYGKFDLVYVSIGVLVWIPDIKLLIRNASKLLKKGGELLIYDQHPFANLFDPDSESKYEVKNDYFRTEPTELRGLDYIGGKEYDAKPNYQFAFRLSDILNGIAENNLRLSKFMEFKHSIEDCRPNKTQDQNSSKKYFSIKLEGVPNMFLLIAEK